MPVHKIHVDIYDKMGEKYTITFQGLVTREKAIRLLDLVELLGGMREFGKVPRWARYKENLTKFERVKLIVEKHYPLTWFSSKDIQSTYFEEFKKPIRLSTVSTYLSRMTDRGFLVKNDQGKRIRYKLATGIIKRFWQKGKPPSRDWFEAAML